MSIGALLLIIAALLYWLLSHTNELHNAYVSAEEMAAAKQTGRVKVRLSHAAPVIALIGLGAFYFAYAIAQGKAPTRLAKIAHDIFGTQGAVATWVLLGTMLLAKGIESILGSVIGSAAMASPPIGSAAMASPPESQAPVAFRNTVFVVALLMAAVALHQIYVSLEGRPVNAALATLLIAGVIGVTRKVRWGRGFAIAFLWGSIFVSFGALSPFNAGDLMAEGIEPPSILGLAIQFTGVCATALICLHYLGKYKSLFRATWI